MSAEAPQGKLSIGDGETRDSKAGSGGKKVNYPGKPEGEREMPVDAGATGGG